MTEQFLRLNRNWALAFDSRQWIIQLRHGPDNWIGRKFVGGRLDDLMRCLAEMRIVPTPEARVALDQMAETFGAFLAQKGVDRPRDDIRSKRYGTGGGKDPSLVFAKSARSAISTQSVSEHPKTEDRAVANSGEAEQASEKDELVRLNEDWSVFDDQLQWILKRRGKNDSWSARSFCRTRRVLLHEIREQCGFLDPAAVAYVQSWPESHEPGVEPMHQPMPIAAE